MANTDQSLIQKYFQGDMSALEMLIEKHIQNMFQVAFRICEDEQDAHDITQNACLKIIQNIGRFEQKSAFSTWAFRIAYNESLGFLRSKKVYLDLDDFEPSETETSFSNDIDINDRESLVRNSLERLAKIDKSIMLFFYYDELKIKEIAEIMNMNENTIKTRLKRSKEFLYVCLEPLGNHL